MRESVSEIREHLEYFLVDNSGKTPEELEKIALKLKPGGAHTDGYLISLVMQHMFLPDPQLVAAVLYRTWKGGKVGFQFLSNPRETETSDYEEEVQQLLSRFWDYEIDPRTILTNTYERDRDFYNSLPERITIYRGGCGIEPERLARGVCWTTSRAVAEWFANRLCADDKEPVLISARVHKRLVTLAFDSEYEIVAQPYRWRALKCPRKEVKRPRMSWSGEERG
jgi:hypothetical protein